MFTSLHVGPPCMLDFCRFLLQLEIRFHNFGHCRHTTIESTNIFPLFWTWSPNTKEVTVIIYDLFTMQNHALNKTHTHIYTHRYYVYGQEPKYDCWMFLEPRGVYFNGSVLASSCWQSIHHYLFPIDVKLEENLNPPFHTNSK